MGSSILPARWANRQWGAPGGRGPFPGARENLCILNTLWPRVAARLLRAPAGRVKRGTRLGPRLRLPGGANRRGAHPTGAAHEARSGWFDLSLVLTLLCPSHGLPKGHGACHTHEVRAGPGGPGRNTEAGGREGAADGGLPTRWINKI